MYYIQWVFLKNVWVHALIIVKITWASTPNLCTTDLVKGTRINIKLGGGYTRVPSATPLTISCICNRFTYLKLDFEYIGINVVSVSRARFIDFDIDGIVATVWFFLLPLESLITTFNNCDGIVPSLVLFSVLTLDVITILIRIGWKNAVKLEKEFMTISNLCGRIRLLRRDTSLKEYEFENFKYDNETY